MKTLQRLDADALRPLFAVALARANLFAKRKATRSKGTRRKPVASPPEKSGGVK